MKITKTILKENILKYCENNYNDIIIEIIEQMEEASKNGEVYIVYDICANHSPENQKMLKGLRCYFDNLGFNCRINSPCTELTIWLY